MKDYTIVYADGTSDKVKAAQIGTKDGYVFLYDAEGGVVAVFTSSQIRGVAETANVI